MRVKVFPWVAMLLTAATAMAVRPQTWSHQTEQDFAEGTFENTVINSYGELTLGRELKAVPLEAGTEMVLGIVIGSDGAAYAAATTPDAKVFRIAGGKAKVFYVVPEEDGVISAIAADAKGDVLVATSTGKKGKLVRVAAGATAGKPATVFEKEGVEHIWAAAPAGDGALYVGTGPKAQVFKVAADGKSAVVLEAAAGAAKNIISLAIDREKRLIAGTDANGLVIRVGEDGKPFVLHEAGNVDITALAVDDDGNVYAAAAKPEGGGGFDMGDEGARTKSKPGAGEPELLDMPDENVVPQPAPKKDVKPKTEKDKGEGAAAELLPFGVLADKNPPLPPEIAALLKKAGDSAKALKDGPTTKKKKPPLATKPMVGGAKHKPARHGGGRSDDFDAEPTNAVYKIAPDGGVTTIASGQDMMTALLWHKGPAGGELLIGTGVDGKIFAYTPADEGQTLIARVKEETVGALAAGADGTVYVGASDMGQVYVLSPNLAKEGTFTSKALDAAHAADWGAARLAAGAAPAGTGAAIRTRSGNTREVEKSDTFWSAWSEPASEKISSPKARYLQYRVTLTGDGKETSPTVTGVKLSYQVANLPPKIKNLTVEAERGDDFLDALAGGPVDAPEPAPPVSIAWDANDPNHDALTYRIYCKPAGAASEPWTLVAKDLKTATYDWNTQSVADGKYQVKVIASDAADNPPEEAKTAARVSAAFVVDHTPPELAELKADVGADGRVTVAGSAKDGLSPIIDVRFQVDGQTDWQPAKPSDKIFDSLSEAFTVVTRALPAGGHRITVRATDSAGNAAYKTVVVTVK